MMANIKVNGLPLPPDLLRLIAERRWKRPADVNGLAELTAVRSPASHRRIASTFPDFARTIGLLGD